MKLLIFVSILISCTLANSYLYPVPLQQLQAPLILVKTQQQTGIRNKQEQQGSVQQQIQQYFTHDNLGQYSYGYIEPLSTKQEIRTLDGITAGSYSYIDANGLLQTVDYTADDEGFHVLATNLPNQNSPEAPQPVKETPEVAAAREQHLAAHKAILEGNPSASLILPKPVEDTAEVVEAKREFFARFSAEQEKQKLLRNTALSRNQHVILSSAFKSIKPSLTVSKSGPTLGHFAATKTAVLPEIGRFAYGYKTDGAIQPFRYYLPIV